MTLSRINTSVLGLATLGNLVLGAGSEISPENAEAQAGVAVTAKTKEAFSVRVPYPSESMYPEVTLFPES